MEEKKLENSNKKNLWIPMVVGGLTAGILYIVIEKCRHPQFPTSKIISEGLIFMGVFMLLVYIFSKLLKHKL